MATKDQRQLQRAYERARQTGAPLTTWHRQAAGVLLTVNGRDVALAYIAGLASRPSARERAGLVCVWCGQVQLTTRRCAGCGTLLCPVCDRAGLCRQCRGLAELLDLVELVAPPSRPALEIILGYSRLGDFTPAGTGASPCI